MQPNVKVLMQSVKQQLSPLFQWILLKSTLRILSLNIASSQHQISSWSDEKCWENKAIRFCTALIVWPLGKVKVSESGIKW